VTIPEEAVTAAAVAIHDADCPDTDCSGSALGHSYRLARAALNAAAPLIAEEALRDARAARTAGGLFDLPDIPFPEEATA
jgi:hypothetical protein